VIAPAITRLDRASFPAAVADLAVLLADTVASGSSLGFLQPFTAADAAAWWRTLAAEVTLGRIVVLAARFDGAIVGTVQLRLAPMPNARHRAEVSKMLVHPAARRRGVGRALMGAIEQVAREERRRLLVLDTETGSQGEPFYGSLGWTRAGMIPRYATGPEGGLRSTTIFFKEVV
jgi:GNAT superfamily N-acetyltransferase